MMQFVEFPKIPRLSRECVITEKIDGTNASVYIDSATGTFLVGSRTRWITPEQDNHGFARWAFEHREGLLGLGDGHHFGEWWGSGIQRGYGLQKGEKRFSLFNVARWADERDREKFPIDRPACCHVVPILYRGDFTTFYVTDALKRLGTDGSKAAPGFMNPEGVVVFHEASRQMFKKTLERDEEPKSKMAQKVVAAAVCALLAVSCGKDYQSPTAPDPAVPTASVTPAASCVSQVRIWQEASDNSMATPISTVRFDPPPEGFTIEPAVKKYISTPGKLLIFEGEFSTDYQVRAKQGACAWTEPYLVRLGPANTDGTEKPYPPAPSPLPIPTPTPTPTPVPPYEPYAFHACYTSPDVTFIDYKGFGLAAPAGRVYAVTVTQENVPVEEGQGQTNEVLSVLVNGKFVGLTTDTPSVTTFTVAGPIDLIELEAAGESVHRACVTVGE